MEAFLEAAEGTDDIAKHILNVDALCAAITQEFGVVIANHTKDGSGHIDLPDGVREVYHLKGTSCIVYFTVENDTVIAHRQGEIPHGWSEFHFEDHNFEGIGKGSFGVSLMGVLEVGLLTECTNPDDPPAKLTLQEMYDNGVNGKHKHNGLFTKLELQGNDITRKGSVMFSDIVGYRKA